MTLLRVVQRLVTTDSTTLRPVPPDHFSAETARQLGYCARPKGVAVITTLLS